MKIKRLLLRNFIGIQHGLNLDELEIKFPDNPNRITMLRGGNGSGKSTIMSQLHPFKDSFDDRKDLILEGKEGRKEIDIEHNGHLYQIVHIYSSSGQSFIKEDGKELNENGGIRTCESIIKEKLGITSDFFSMGKIGSNTKNFVDFTTVQRKNYIGTFLNIEELLDKYKIVSEKLKNLKKEIASVGGDLSKYEDYSVVETKIKTLQENISAIEKYLNEALPKQGSLITKIERDTQDIGGNTLEDLQQKIDQKNADMEFYNKSKAELEPKIDTSKPLSDKISELQLNVSELQGDLRVKDAEKTNKNLLITDYKNKVSTTKIEISNLGNPEDLEVLKAEIEKLDLEINNLKNEIKTNSMTQIIHELKKNKKDIFGYLNKFIDFTNFIEKYFTNLQNNSIINSKSNIELFMEEDCSESFERQIRLSRTTIDGKNQLLESQQKIRTLQESHVCQLKNLEKRPKECTIDSCPFIKDAYEHRDVQEKIAEQNAAILQTKKDIDVLTVKAENLEENSNLYKLFTAEWEKVLPRENVFLSKFLENKSLIEYVKGPVSEFKAAKENLINEITTGNSLLDSFVEKTGIKNIKETSKKALEDSDSSVREKYEKDLVEFEGKIEQLTNEYNILDSQSKEILKTYIEKQTELQAYLDYQTALSKIASLTTSLYELNKTYKKVDELLKGKIAAEAELKLLNTKIAVSNRDKEAKRNELNIESNKLAQIKVLKDRLDNLNKDFAPIDKVATALSPKSGIPLILIKVYLEETEAITNELLDIAYNGDFRINFMTNEKEFAIRVLAKENIKNDIKLASQGEIALTTISISLALIEQSVGDYNILCLDEIDGPLDKDNREKFIEILTKQIEKLGIEQVFVISHNDAFDNCPLDLILLRDSGIDTKNESYMENKNIIYNYEGE